MAILFSVNTDVFAQRGCEKGKANRGDNSCKNIPDLTDEQETKIKKLRTAHMKEMQNYDNKIAEKHARLQTLRTAEKVDMKLVNKTVDEIGAIRTNKQKNKEQHNQKVRSLLTADQKIYFDNSKSNSRNGRMNANKNRKGNRNGKGKCCRK